jgi:hypothetical protein
MDCWTTNSDGAGVAWYEGGKLHIRKGFMSWGAFSEFWHEEERDWDNVPALIHFRIATHGAKDEDNTHPFWVFPKTLAFAHNGMFFNVPKDAGALSDTQLFNRHYLKQLPRNFMNNSGIKLFIDDFIGKGNKLAFIDEVGDIHIFGEESGTWDDEGVWFSNTNHEWKFTKGRYKKRSIYDVGTWDKYVPGNSRSGCAVDSVWSNELNEYVTREEAIDAVEAEEQLMLAEGSLPWGSYDDDIEEYYCYYCQTTFQADEVGAWNKYKEPVCPICMGSGCSVNINELNREGGIS